ncbi:hypothetical protein [Campylobacter phage CJLB-12]|nr:hypothetical protein [Campylobacter phage CJLB-12]
MLIHNGQEYEQLIIVDLLILLLVVTFILYIFI